MTRFCRLCYVGVALCLLCACVSSGEDALEPVGLGQTSVEDATATPAGVRATPRASLRPPATLAPKALTPFPAIVKEDVEMMPTISVSPGVQEFVDQAVADLAERLDIGAEQIELVEARAVVCPDGSLGCPQPGLAYIQVQQDGLLIRLRVGKRVHSYHSGGKRAPFLCENPITVDENLAPSPGLGNE